MNHLLLGLLVPVSITVVALSVHYLFAYLIRRKEIRYEKAKVIRLNQLLGETGCENEEVSHPQNWAVNIC